MAIFQTSATKKDPSPSADGYAASAGRDGIAPSGAEAAQSLIAAGLSIEGKIEGTGHVRIAGRFKGEVNIEGNLAVDQDARLTGTLRARQIALAGELEGTIESADRVDLLAASVLVGDIKTSTLTVTAGSRIRGSIDCGWEQPPAAARITAAATTGSSDSDG